MQRAINTAVLVFSITAFASQAAAYFATGGQFSQMCERDRISAQAYAAGVVDGFVAKRAEVQAPNFACLPDDLRLSQIRAIACAFAQDPSRHDAPASYVIMTALDQQWPCEDAQ